jgi:hypothetical protein
MKRRAETIVRQKFTYPLDVVFAEKVNTGKNAAGNVVFSSTAKAKNGFGAEHTYAWSAEIGSEESRPILRCWINDDLVYTDPGLEAEEAIKAARVKYDLPAKADGNTTPARPIPQAKALR